MCVYEYVVYTYKINLCCGLCLCCLIVMSFFHLYNCVGENSHTSSSADRSSERGASQPRSRPSSNRRGAVVRHQVGERAERRVRRKLDEVGDVRGVQTCVLLHLLRPARVLGARLEQAPPSGVVGLVLPAESLVQCRGEHALLVARLRYPLVQLG